MLLEVLIRLASQLIQLAGKKMDAQFHNLYYSISKEDMTCLTEECKRVGVDPSSPGCVYAIAFFLRNKYQILDKTNDIEAFSKESNRKKLEKLIETNDDRSIIYIGKSKNRAIERICGDTSKAFLSSHFELGVNSILLELLQLGTIEGEVIALPVVNFPQASTTMSDQTEIIYLIFEAVIASVLSMDTALCIEEGNSTNIAPCGGIGFSTFDLRFKELIDYKGIHGNCAVSTDTPGLGIWVQYLRYEYKKFLANSENSFLTEERIKKLNDVGFIWDHHEDPFNLPFTELIEYKEIHRNCAVPVGTKGLGIWVGTQRYEYKKFLANSENSFLTEERIKKLNDVGFIWSMQQ